MAASISLLLSAFSNPKSLQHYKHLSIEKYTSPSQPLLAIYLSRLLCLCAYQSAINNIDLPNLTSDDVIERDCLVYRSYIALGQFQLVINEIDSSAATPLQTVKLLALNLSSPSNKESAISSLKDWLADPAIANNSTLRLIAGTVFMHEEDYNRRFRLSNDLEIRPLVERDSKSLQRLIAELPFWVKNPDYDRVDWINKLNANMWPYLDKGICKMVKTISKPIIAEQIPKYKIQSVDFEVLSLGMKVLMTDEKELIIEPLLKWAGNPNIIVAAKAFGLRATVQVVDLQVFASPRITLKPLMFCLLSVLKFCSCDSQPHVDFGLKVIGADVMSIPVRAIKLKRKDFLGWSSDPYVKLKLSEEKLAAKKSKVCSVLIFHSFQLRNTSYKEFEKVLAIILGIMSVVIILAEATLLPSVDLSLISILIDSYLGMTMPLRYMKL
ncbi:hypothetical protein ACFE04_026973 [Oxalis oulophora]